MTAINSYVDPDDVDDSWIENILHIAITAKTAAEMPVHYIYSTANFGYEGTAGSASHACGADR